MQCPFAEMNDEFPGNVQGQTDSIDVQQKEKADNNDQVVYVERKENPRLALVVSSRLKKYANTVEDVGTKGAKFICRKQNCKAEYLYRWPVGV